MNKKQIELLKRRKRYAERMKNPVYRKRELNKMKEWRKNNPEKHKKSKRNWVKNNKEKHLKSRRKAHKRKSQNMEYVMHRRKILNAEYHRNKNKRRTKTRKNERKKYKTDLKFRFKRLKAWRKRHPRKNKKCIICGEKFVWEYKGAKPQKYCKKCKEYGKRLWARLYYIKTNGFYNQFRGPDWELQRLRTLSRDKGKCKKCNGKKDLVVHHKVAYRKTKNNNLKNLVTLCRSCHAVIENKIKKYGVIEGSKIFWQEYFKGGIKIKCC